MIATLSLVVSKRPEVDRYAHPSIRIRIATNRDEPVAVRLVESLPEGVDEAAVGFHRDEGYEHWSVTGDGRIVYEDTVRASDPVSTLFGVFDADAETLLACLREPTVEVADADDVDAVAPGDWVPLGDDRVDVRTDEGELRSDTRPTDRQTSPTGGDWDDADTTMDRDDPNTDGAEHSATDTDSGSEPPVWSEPTTVDPAQTDGGSGSAQTEGDAESTTEAATTGEEPPATAQSEASVVEAFAAELRRDEASEQAVATLRSHLAPDRQGSVDAKLDHCMTRIGELDAYVDALEEFLDEEGTAEQLLGEVRDDLARLEGRFDDVERRIESVERAQARIDDRLTTVDATLDDVQADLDAVEDVDESVADLESALADTRVELADAVETVEAEVSTLESDVQNIEEWRSTVVSALSAGAGAEGVATESDAD